MSFLRRVLRRPEMRRPNYEFGSGVSVIGGAAVLEWARVFGDGGPILQLILGVVGFVVGMAIFLTNWLPAWRWDRRDRTED